MIVFPTCSVLKMGLGSVVVTLPPFMWVTWDMGLNPMCMWSTLYKKTNLSISGLYRLLNSSGWKRLHPIRLNSETCSLTLFDDYCYCKQFLPLQWDYVFWNLPSFLETSPRQLFGTFRAHLLWQLNLQSEREDKRRLRSDKDLINLIEDPL